jgi:hypothetical protein
MALRRQVHHQAGISLLHRRRRGFGVGQIHLQQAVNIVALESRSNRRTNAPPMKPPPPVTRSRLIPWGSKGGHGLNQACRRLPGNPVLQTIPTRQGISTGKTHL